MIITVKLIDRNLKEVFFDNKHIIIEVDDEPINKNDIELNKIEDKTNEKTYEIKLKNLEYDSMIEMKIIEGTAIDNGGLKNEEIEIYFDGTEMMFDNTEDIEIDKYEYEEDTEEYEEKIA